MSNLSCSYSSRITPPLTPLLPARRGLVDEGRTGRSLVIDALMMAVWRRGKADALFHHSDQGSQYTQLFPINPCIPKQPLRLFCSLSHPSSL